MTRGVHTTKASAPADAVDWLALFPSEGPSKPGEFERPRIEDPFELFPLERRLLDPEPVLPTRQLQPLPRPAIRIVVEPIDPGWQLPRIQLSAPAWTMILTGVAVMLLSVFMWTRLPPLPEVAQIVSEEPARSIDVPRGAGPAGGTWTLARTAKGWTLETGETAYVDLAALAATGKSLPIPQPKASPAARVPTPPALPAKPGTPPTRPAEVIASRSEPATAAITPPAGITPPAAATFAADVNAGSPPTLATARVPDVALATLAPAALTPPPADPPPRATDPVAGRAADTAAIESVLGRYRSAFGALDVHDVQRVWPQVDRRALERTFSEVDEHALQFDGCRIDITGRDARAACSGIARSLPKGSARPKLESRRWDFTLSKIGTDWLILSAQTRR